MDLTVEQVKADPPPELTTDDLRQLGDVDPDLFLEFTPAGHRQSYEFEDGPKYERVDRGSRWVHVGDADPP